MQKDAVAELEEKLDESYDYCRDVARKSSSNFYLGMLLTSKKKRRDIFAIFAIFAWLRAIDDITDDERNSCEERCIKLRQFRETTFAVINESNEYCCQLKEKYWPALRQTIIRYNIPIVYLESIIASQKQDLVKDNYQTFNELYVYCRLGASTVGLMMMHIWGYQNDEKAKLLAEWCGVAIQLTNILRDINEDLIKLNRVYIPAEFLNRDKLTATDLRQIPQEEMMKAINQIILKANDYYQKSELLYKYIHKDGRLGLLVMVGHYRALFNKIRSNPKIIFTSKKIKVNRLEKFYYLFRALLKY